VAATSSGDGLLGAVAAAPEVDARVVGCGAVPASFSSYRGGLRRVAGPTVVGSAARWRGDRRGWWGGF
jgi:hypothetical protein